MPHNTIIVRGNCAKNTNIQSCLVRHTETNKLYIQLILWFKWMAHIHRPLISKQFSDSKVLFPILQSCTANVWTVLKHHFSKQVCRFIRTRSVKTMLTSGRTHPYTPHCYIICTFSIFFLVRSLQLHIKQLKL